MDKLEYRIGRGAKQSEQYEGVREREKDRAVDSGEAEEQGERKMLFGQPTAKKENGGSIDGKKRRWSIKERGREK
jgi:hypothetical protein